MLNFINCIYMTDNDRVLEVIKLLITNRTVRNQQDFVERIGSDKATISQVKTGKIQIPNNLFAKIADAFPIISREWLETGEGEMLKPSNSNHVEGNGNTAVAGNGNQITTSNITELLELQKGYQEMIKICQGQLSESQSQINRLISIIEQPNKK
jgi:transcriptional regulator with XRE-family HTH domain